MRPEYADQKGYSAMVRRKPEQRERPERFRDYPSRRHTSSPSSRSSSPSTGCWWRPRGVRRRWAASACTSGRWCTRTDGAIRHDWPLRLGGAGTDEVVEGHRIACSHFDAFRFFTDSARPLNTLQPGRDDRAEFEQPGCLHAGMDLYKHAFRLTPLVPSELVADCFELAWDIRELDMRASPYDFSDLGLEPVRIETPEGKQEYVARPARTSPSAALPCASG